MGELKIGEHTYGTIVRRGDMNTVTVGKYCSIADNVVCDSGFQHNMKNISTFPFNSRFGADVPHNATCKGDIIIGNDVWIGENVLIMGGVTIGNGAVIGANCVVTKDVDHYEVVAGNPMKHIRYRFNIFGINQLLNLKWWDWKHELVLERAKDLNNDNFKNLEKYEQN